MSVQESVKLAALKDGNRETDRAAIESRIGKRLGNKRTTDLKSNDLVEFEAIFRGDTALVYYAAKTEAKNDGRAGTEKFRAIEVFNKRNGEWISETSDVKLQNSGLTHVSAEAQKMILDEREKVWRAWFAYDKAALETAIPEEIIVISPGQKNFKHRAEILASSEQFVKTGGKLVRLEFPKDEIQVYGSTIILYTDYLYEVEVNGKKELSTGRATDMFVIRDNGFVNVGWHLDTGK